MTLMSFVIIFVTTFVSVFLLGFQSKNVHQSRYALAALTSSGIALTQYVFIRYAMTTEGLLFVLTSALGGSAGIVTAIYTHDRVISKSHKKGK